VTCTWASGATQRRGEVLGGWAGPVALAQFLIVACASVPEPRPVPPPTERERGAADLWSIVPARAAAALVLDLRRLRASPWTQGLVNGAAAGTATADDGEIEALAFVKLEPAAEAPLDLTEPLAIRRGRFDLARLKGAILATHRDALVRRGCEGELITWGPARADEAGEGTVPAPSRGALAVEPGGLLIEGSPEDVAAVLAARCGRAGSLADERWFAEGREALVAARGDVRAPITLAVRIGSALSQVLADALPGARSLDSVVGSLSVGAAGPLSGRVVGRGARRDPALARELTAAVTALAARRSVVALGLGEILARARVSTSGPVTVLAFEASEAERARVVTRVEKAAALLRVRARAEEAGEGTLEPSAGPGVESTVP
jgi:hypothetical protein